MADLSKFNAKALAEIDREISEFRSEYHELEPQSRKAFREWLNQLKLLCDVQPTDIPMTTLCRIDRLDTDSEGEVIRDGVVYLNPETMLAAVEAWDVGEKFTPASFVQPI